jgi:hypothetical protein
MIMQRLQSLATTATLNPNNFWAGSAFEYLKGPAFIAIALYSITTQALSGVLSAAYIGSNLIAEEYTVPNQDPAIWGANLPQIQNAFYLTGGGNGGDRIVNTLRNPTGGTVVTQGTAIITPAGRGRR